MIPLLAVLTMQEPARNPHAVQPERPTVATHAHTVAPGWTELELGGEWDRYSASAHGYVVPVTSKTGITSHTQLTVQTGLNNPSGNAWSFGDVMVGVKWRLLDQAPVLGDFAVLPNVKVPTSDGGTTDVGLLLVSSHMLGPVGMDLNFGYVRRSGNGTVAPRDATVWAASFGGTFTESVGWVAELHGFPGTTGPAGQTNIVRVLAGPTFMFKEWMAFDVGGTISLDGPMPDAIYVGSTINIGRIWGRP